MSSHRIVGSEAQSRRSAFSPAHGSIQIVRRRASLLEIVGLLAVSLTSLIAVLLFLTAVAALVESRS